MQEQATSSLAASSLPSSSERSSSSAPHLEIKEGIESDEEIRRVPEFGGEAVGKETSAREDTGGEREQAAEEVVEEQSFSSASKREEKGLLKRVGKQSERLGEQKL
ncbi:unnamed protein product [Arabidopsis thaliana]|uniref:(thale cress) hypothetical protein n=1 Tax=Arabidopsis thaliana TaxID=3702 RepID=A0A7G2FCU0_ARATH|nr:unnamed protein product [Arabidopsis thaliana]